MYACAWASYVYHAAGHHGWARPVSRFVVLSLQFVPPPVSLFVCLCIIRYAYFLPRDAMLARYMLSSCVESVCLSVARLHCTKTAKRKITQTTRYDSPGTLVY